MSKMKQVEPMSRLSKWLRISGVAAFLFGLSHNASADPSTKETIVMVRHGEKPAAGLGQLDCQGLNRSLALRAVIRKLFGTPTVIYAPDPAKPIEDNGKLYDYVRPLATIEPAAIQFGLPVNAKFGLSDTEALRRELEFPDKATDLVVIAWEHKQIVDLARQLVQDFGGNGLAIPDWKGNDFDSIYVVRITRSEDHSQALFYRQEEGLDGQPKSCPQPLSR